MFFKGKKKTIAPAISKPIAVLTDNSETVAAIMAAICVFLEAENGNLPIAPFILRRIVRKYPV